MHSPFHAPDQVVDVHQACHGDSARPLGNDSMGTNCPAVMGEQSACTAQCNSGAAAVGAFMRLASKIRLEPVGPGHDSVMVWDRVLYTLGARAPECPSPEKLRIILAGALEVHSDQVDGVAREAGEEVPPSEDDTRMVGIPQQRP